LVDAQKAGDGTEQGVSSSLEHLESSTHEVSLLV
jgi:hypothetical protein